jgi:Integrase core domain
MVRKRGGRKRALGMRAPTPVLLAPNDRWSLDFVSDQFVCGRRFRILAVFDDCTRECLATVADTSLSGLRVVRELDLLIAWRGRPKNIVSYGTELTSNAIFCWARQTKVDWHYIDPGKPSWMRRISAAIQFTGAPKSENRPWIITRSPSDTIIPGSYFSVGGMLFIRLNRPSRPGAMNSRNGPAKLSPRRFAAFDEARFRSQSFPISEINSLLDDVDKFDPIAV